MADGAERPSQFPLSFSALLQILLLHSQCSAVAVKQAKTNRQIKIKIFWRTQMVRPFRLVRIPFVLSHSRMLTFPLKSDAILHLAFSFWVAQSPVERGETPFNICSCLFVCPSIRPSRI